MRTPRRLSSRPSPARLLLLATTSLFVWTGAAPAIAQACTGSPCIITGVPVTTPFNSTLVTAQPLVFTNTASFNIQAPANDALVTALQVITSGGNGANSDSQPAGSGSPASTLQFTNQGTVTHNLPTMLTNLMTITAYTVHGASAGGNGGNYTNDDAKHDAGESAPGANAGMLNSASITVSAPGVPVAGLSPSINTGAALLVESLGGNGGNVRRQSSFDENGNPTYDGHNGHSGAAAGQAALNNTATIQVNLAQPQVGQWYWGAAARSLGGAAGTGTLGRNGGAGDLAAVSNTGNVDVSFAWGTPVGTPQPASLGGFAVAAISQGGMATQSVSSGNNGGAGGGAADASLFVSGQAAPVTIRLNTSNPFALATTPFSAALAAISLGGDGGRGYDDSTGGQGGRSGTPGITVGPGVTILATGDRTRGILALSQGGAGGSSGVGQNRSAAGAGGGTDGGGQNSNWITLTSTTVSTTGALSAGVMAASLGGAGGLGLDYTKSTPDEHEGGTGGAGGNAAPVLALMTNGSITTTGPQSPGLVALAQGGNGGNGGATDGGTGGGSGTGGRGGQAGAVTVTVNGNASIGTLGATGNGDPGFGVFAASVGGIGGAGGAITNDFASGRGNGGAGGSAGLVTINLAAAGSVSTRGDGAVAVLGRSLGGAGGNASLYSTAGFVSTDGNGGKGGDAGPVSITNAATLSTSGQAAHGIVAQSAGGSGGLGANGTGAFDGSGGSGGASGLAGIVTIVNSGVISTTGVAALGIMAQSIGASGGSGGAGDGAFYGPGGSAGAGSNGGQASVTHSGRIATSGAFGIGLLAQSVGGGGGNAGGSNTIFTSLGGSGGGGGAGSLVTVNLAGGSIATQGRLAYGVVAQSIGGGGGNGGDASSTGLIITLAIGGTSGDGGAGGAVTLNASGGTITTTGSNAGGILAQSIGGGGGAAGSGYTTDVGVYLTVAAAVGAAGGKGGAGGNVTLGLSGLTIATGQATLANVNTNPVDAYGIHVQSIGGGGGVGGSATAQAITLALPVTQAGTSVGASASFAMGGSGGAAGDGGSVALTLNGNSRVTTQGQGSHALLLQSVGGGGGAGGDSSAMATTLGYGRASTYAGASSISVTASLALGGSGSSGGSGGAVTALVDSAAVTTYGDFANALVAQSIGGGGGSGGLGSSSTASSGISTPFSASLGLGGKAGAGGAGGDVTLTIGPAAVIQTYGASAIGVLGQSIGGGGGTGQGGVSGAGLPHDRSLEVNVGMRGGSGGHGGSVTATIQGAITTRGSDAPALMLQSIGGGGGVGGSAGAEASSDNPIDPVTGIRYIVTSLLFQKSPEFPYSKAAQLSLGGTGGNGGNGGLVTFSQSSALATTGDWSHGAVLQSIGGGGGTGGTAEALSSELGVAANLALGGAGGAGGPGGSVNITLGAGSSITTGSASSGYAAFGLLAQSIGGGGGAAAEGSVASQLSLSLGASANLGGGAGNNGGTVTVTGAASIRTQGSVAAGMVLQSIGAGGGVGGGGTSFTVGLGPVSGTTSIRLGSSNGASGDGGRVNVNNAALTITTSGSHAYGLLAQSIGGGGGFGFSATPTPSIVNSAGAQATGGFRVGDGGLVTLTLQGGGITTTGFAAHGIVAQSIGGGGGIAGLPTSPATLTIGGGGGGTTPGGNGGGVQINSSTPITTSGTAAHGIVVQSIGGGGGLVAQGGVLFAGSSSAGLPGAQGLAGQVSVTQNAAITTSGANSIGIFAQARAPEQNVGGPGLVSVVVNAAIRGGSGATGWGIWTDAVGTGAQIDVNAAGSVSALSGQAILMTPSSGNNVVYNWGTVTGSYSIGTRGVFSNQNGGVLNAGATLEAGRLENAGTVRVASHAAYGVSAVTGDFVQRGSGRLLLDADFSNRRAGVMTVAGAAELAGQVRPVIVSVLPNVELPFLAVSGPVTGSLAGDRTSIFSYDVQRKGGSFTVAANADFTPAGYSLPRNASAMAGHLQAAWDAGGAGLGPLFALLGNTADAGGEGAYRAALRQISPDASLAPGARLAAGARAFANAAMSCPQFEGSTAMLREGECVWAGLTGRTATQSSQEGLSSFRLNSTTWQAGGQRALGQGWFLGGSLAFENTRLTTPDRMNSGRGEAGFGAVTLKYQTGPWLLAGAVFGGGGQFTSTRTITLPGFGAVARGSPSLAHAGAMLRGIYTIGQEEFYLRPSLSLSLVHARSGAYRESGAGVLDLEVATASSNVAAVTPAIELGGRQNFANGMVMRLYASAGLSLLSEGRWSQESRLVSASTAAGRFSGVVRTDQAVARVAAGGQIFATDRLELRLQYEGEYSASLTGHGGSLALALRF